MKIYSNGKMIEAGGGSAQDIYSTEETRIGTWIDGKPLYRKVFEVTLPSSDTSDEVIATTENDKVVVNLYGMFLYNDRQTQPLNAPLPSTNPSGTYVFYKRGEIRIALKGINFYSHPAWIVIEYTKTTDQPTVSTAEILTAYLDGFSADDMEAPAAAAASSGTEIINQEEA